MQPHHTPNPHPPHLLPITPRFGTRIFIYRSSATLKQEIIRQQEESFQAGELKVGFLARGNRVVEPVCFGGDGEGEGQCQEGRMGETGLRVGKGKKIRPFVDRFRNKIYYRKRS